jgi:thymidylate kinase
MNLNTRFLESAKMGAVNNNNNDDERADHHRPFLITFSGIDGAGKTTQIELLASFLQQRGFRVLRFTFWDHVAALSKMRAGVGQRTVGSSETDLLAKHSCTPKNNKHIRKWYLSLARSGMYLLDVFRLRRLLASEFVQNSDVVIFDRYIYDQIANVYSRSHAAHIYSRALLNQTPVPDLAFIIDTSPDAAFARKPEYPLEFMRANRENFLQLCQVAPRLITISEGAQEDVTSEINFHLQRCRLLEEIPNQAKTGVSVISTLLFKQSSCKSQNEPTASV